MTGKTGGAKSGWPFGFDTKDPEGIADFCLGLGYEFTAVVNTVRDRCSIDTLTARSIVADVARRQGVEVPSPNEEVH